MKKKLYQSPISELVVLDPLMVQYGIDVASGGNMLGSILSEVTGTSGD